MKIFTLLLLFIASHTYAINIPHNSGPVVDQSNIFSNSEKKALSRSLMKLKLQTGPEVQILIIDSLEGESIENYSISVMDKWKIGSKSADNGVLFLIALNDRKMRIEVGDGLEGTLTDLDSNRIIQRITPFFKQAKYRDGIVAGASLIAQKLGGELTAAPKSHRRKKSGGMNIISIIFFILFFAFSSGRGGRGGGGLMSALFIGSMLSGGGRSSYGGGDSFGGSFGGGGSFSGGGASGGW